MTAERALKRSAFTLTEEDEDDLATVISSREVLYVHVDVKTDIKLCKYVNNYWTRVQ